MRRMQPMSLSPLHKLVAPPSLASMFASSDDHIYVDDLRVDTDTDSMPSLSPFSPGTSSSATSFESDDLRSRTSSPQPSVYSFTSSMRQQVYRQEYGRELNSFSEVYCLPADEEEIGRLDKQHEMFKLLLGYPWAPPMQEVLAPEPFSTKAIIDLGCGSGAWIMDAASAFPHCSAVGVDLIPMQPLYLPTNCRSEVDDINLGLQHYYNSFDVAHVRLVSSGIKDYHRLIDQIAHCLRPRGLIEALECDFRIYGPDKTVLAPWSTCRPASEASNMSRWFYALNRAFRQKGGDIDAASHLHSWVQEQGSFAEEEIVYRDIWCPASPWEPPVGWDARTHKRNGEMMREDIHSFLRGGRPLLLGSGLSCDEVDELETNSHRELDECKIPMFVRIQTVYARKKAG